METPTALWLVAPFSRRPTSFAKCKHTHTRDIPLTPPRALFPPALDQRIPGWVTGYVRRFWQVCNPLPPSDEPPTHII